MFTTRKEREIFSYKPLALVDEEGLDLSTEPPKPPTGSKTNYRLFLYVLWAIAFAQAVALALLILGRDASASTTCRPDLVYSPAQDAVEYQLKTFRYDPVFSAPPSDSLDKAWSDLYQFGISRITREDALLLPNKTSPIPGDEGYYIAELEVFHGLHCLNMIRKTLYSEYYTDMRLGIDGNDDHISHCVDSLRQTLMCSSDISTIVWQWHEKENRNLAHADVARTCRNFEAIQKWGRDNRMRVPYNDSIRVHDDDMADNSTGY